MTIIRLGDAMRYVFSVVECHPKLRKDGHEIFVYQSNKRYKFQWQ